MYEIIFSNDEKDLIIQVLKMFCDQNQLKDLPLLCKFLNNENTFEKEEVYLLYLWITELKRICEKHLDNSNVKDENLLLNYKGFNHCLRKCRIELEKHGVNVNELKSSYKNFSQDFNSHF